MHNANKSSNKMKSCEDFNSCINDGHIVYLALSIPLEIMESPGLFQN